MASHSMIVVSNRLPISVTKENGKVVLTPSSGGLATAMSSLPGKVFWIGWPGVAAEELTTREKQQVTRELRRHGCMPVFLTTRQIDLFYNGYANNTLWPLFHYFQSLAQYRDEYWLAYKEVNKLFSDVVASQATPTQTIWLHDYHLLLLPQLLRTSLPESTIGFFLHTPFPSYEIFRLLPERGALLKGLLGADLIGFHIYDYARHFLSSTLRILGIEHYHGTLISDNRIIKIDVFPIGIDYRKFIRTLKTQRVVRETEKIRQHYAQQKLVLTVDRLDYSKGILKRLEAYQLFLKQHPDWHERVTLTMIAIPSRTEVETYQELRRTTEETISRINGLFGTIAWNPISYQFHHLPFWQTLALYNAADVALVTPLRDGMNLVAKEYVASKQRGPGVLILSEMAGASDELSEALVINPNDVNVVVSSLGQALAMPEAEQRRRLESMQEQLSKHSIQHWTADFSEQLAETKQRQARSDSKLLSNQNVTALVTAFRRAKRRLLLFDYDGTLRGFVPTPDPAAAAPPPQVIDLLRKLARTPRTTVCIISGRPKEALESWFGDLPLTLAAEHGAWLKTGHTWTQRKATFHQHRASILAILHTYAQRTPGARIEQKDFALVWHYRLVAPELAFVRNVRLRSELEQLLDDTEIGVFSGSKVIEVKPYAINKGAVSTELLATSPADFVLSIGDDYTDEDMFKSLPSSAHTIKVGLGDTAAKHQVVSVENALHFLSKLT